LDFEDDFELVAEKDKFEDDLDLIDDEAWVREAIEGTGGHTKGVTATAEDAQNVAAKPAKSGTTGYSKNENTAGDAKPNTTETPKKPSPTNTNGATLKETEAATAQLSEITIGMSDRQTSSPTVTRKGQGLSFTCYSSPELSGVELDSLDKMLDLALAGGNTGSSQQAAKNAQSSGTAGDPKNASADAQKLRIAQHPKEIAGAAKSATTENPKNEKTAGDAGPTTLEERKTRPEEAATTTPRVGIVVSLSIEWEIQLQAILNNKLLIPRLRRRGRRKRGRERGRNWRMRYEEER
jgi:hypothetical protein